MPRRTHPDALGLAVGNRLRQLRTERGLTLEHAAYESELGSKGYLSDIEAGLAVPTLATLQKLASYLGVELVDVVTFPETNERQRLLDQTRFLPAGTIRQLARENAKLVARQRAAKK